MDLQIENTTLCNARCVFCVHKDMRRKKMTMEDSVFGRVFEEVDRLRSLFRRIIIAGLGEPMLDPGIFEKIRALKETGLLIHIFTNGTGDIRKLAEAGANRVCVSMNAVDRKKRMQVMGRDSFEPLETAILGWDSPNGCELKINFSVGWGLIEEEDLILAQQKYGDKCRFSTTSNWAGKLFPIKVTPFYSCIRPAEFVHVLVDGRVSLCCMDSEGEIILGDSIEESILSKTRLMYVNTMKSQKRKNLPLCGDCTRG